MNILSSLFTNPIDTLITLLALVVAVSVHEFAHAWAAVQLGDDTPRHQGRLTLNPAAHLDPIGSLFFILVGFGWGKPVQYNPMFLKRRSDELLIALAGPASNLLLAIVFNLLAVVLSKISPLANLGPLITMSNWNILLAAFNCTPIPPLDGSAVVAYFYPPYRSLIGSQIGLVLLLIVVFVPFLGGNTILDFILGPVQNFLFHLTHLFGAIPYF